MRVGFWAMVGAAGCAGSSGTADGDRLGTTVGSGDTGAATWRWEATTLDGVGPRWGAMTAGSLVIGGVDGAMRPSADILVVGAGEDGVVSAVPAAASLDLPRYCGCALYDPTRDEVLVVGGRDDRFDEAPSAELIALGTGEHVALDPAGAADHPVGCHAFFAAEYDRGYVFGGYGGGAGFGTTTWRYDPTARTLVPLDLPGPSGRYDGGVELLPGGDALLVGGMGDGGFDSQVWRFDAAAEAWIELAATSDKVPAGRRFPWTSVSGDGATLLYGYGSDSPMGTSVLRDLWSFDLATGEWTRISPEGERPAARGFAARWPGPPGSAGVLAYGVDGDLGLFEDAFVLWVP